MNVITLDSNKFKSIIELLAPAPDIDPVEDAIDLLEDSDDEGGNIHNGGYRVLKKSRVTQHRLR
jgi:hypothetical protein